MTDLSGIMANLELQDNILTQASGSSCTDTQKQEEHTGSHHNLRRSSIGKKIVLDNSPIKRRCSLKPKRNINNTIKGLESYYRNQKFKPPRQTSLETIYEEPLVKAGAVLLMGANKQRRINFSGKISKDKLKKRKTKIKKTLGSKTGAGKKKSQRLTMEAFLLKLHGMVTNSSSNTNNDNELATLVDVNYCNLASKP